MQPSSPHQGRQEHSCPQARYGCDWKGTGSALLLHESDCGWVSKVCSQPGCQGSVFSATQKAHEESCGHRPFSLGPHATGRHLTEAVSFLWEEEAFSRVAVRYVPEERCFTVGVSTGLPFGKDMEFEAKLYGHSVGGWHWLETLGDIDERRGPESLLPVKPGKSVKEGRITVCNRIGCGQDDGFFQQLGPVVWQA